jgi:hypothetical protein
MRSIFTALLPGLLLAACGSPPTSPDSGPKLVYPISANVADKIVFDAVKPELKSAPIQPVTSPHMGYKATIISEQDSIAVVAVRIQAQGQLRNGTTVPCFHFEVTHSGASDAGAAAADRIRARIDAAARLEAGGLPIAK